MQATRWTHHKSINSSSHTPWHPAVIPSLFPPHPPPSPLLLLLLLAVIHLRLVSLYQWQVNLAADYFLDLHCSLFAAASLCFLLVFFLFFLMLVLMVTCLLASVCFSFFVLFCYPSFDFEVEIWWWFVSACPHFITGMSCLPFTFLYLWFFVGFSHSFVLLLPLQLARTNSNHNIYPKSSSDLCHKWKSCVLRQPPSGTQEILEPGKRGFCDSLVLAAVTDGASSASISLPRW